MNVPEDSYVDLLRKASDCPDGKSLRLHIEELRAQVEKLEWLLEVERFWYSHPSNGSCWWDSIAREHSTAEAKAIWQTAKTAIK